MFPTNSRASSIYEKVIAGEFHRALDKMGITPNERKLGNLSFPSWRHFCNSMMRGRVPDARLQCLMGRRRAGGTGSSRNGRLRARE